MTVLKPLFDRILVAQQIVQAPKVSKGGILLPENTANARKTLAQVKVLAVGDGKINPTTNKRLPIESVKVGDDVLIPDFAGYKFVDEKRPQVDTELRLIREDEVLAIIKNA
eukprot:Blabericola_migrator_1__2654@NODE_1752_length_3856_cov_389_225653_g1129_i0_p8_GENE_NODE_1752_length_3856_cov_389_225653_g1129_i0NODE_1752_length_3856_cov_389_225653_g1129_i0_p8_ORF_typecomplete_len111_score28_31Cpn10/PF00166_21/6_1e17_NODE_1752_length_3856_cov_389_225653_g1129_i025402872